MKLLLDEHIWPGLVALVRRMLPSAKIESLHSYADGLLLNRSDAFILAEAARSSRVLVTFDVNTIPPLLQQMAIAEEKHTGVVFISSRTFPQNDHRALARALVSLIPEKKVERIGRIALCF